MHTTFFLLFFFVLNLAYYSMVLFQVILCNLYQINFFQQPLFGKIVSCVLHKFVDYMCYTNSIDLVLCLYQCILLPFHVRVNKHTYIHIHSNQFLAFTFASLFQEVLMLIGDPSAH